MFKAEGLTPVHVRTPHPPPRGAGAEDQKERVASGIRATGLDIKEMAVKRFGLSRDNILHTSQSVPTASVPSVAMGHHPLCHL